MLMSNSLTHQLLLHLLNQWSMLISNSLLTYQLLLHLLNQQSMLISTSLLTYQLLLHLLNQQSMLISNSLLTHQLLLHLLNQQSMLRYVCVRLYVHARSCSCILLQKNSMTYNEDNFFIKLNQTCGDTEPTSESRYHLELGSSTKILNKTGQSKTPYAVDGTISRSMEYTNSSKWPTFGIFNNQK